MRIEYTPHGPPELVREDGWRYRLEGVLGLDWEIGDCLGLYRWASVQPRENTILTVTIAVLSDATFDSLRVLRDELAGTATIRLNHDY